MPLRMGGYEKLQDVPLEERKATDRQFQRHWYHLVAPMCSGQAVLDVGAGTGYGLQILGSYNSHVCGIDIAECDPPVLKMDIKQVPDSSWNWVVAMDVIEHVEDDRGFLGDLLRVAINNVFFSTPNWNRFHAGNKYHVREYTPTELIDLVGAFKYKIYMSDFACRISEITSLSPDEMTENFGVLITK